jgi:flagellin
MALIVNSNIMSLATQRELSTITNRLQGNFQRLASGLRIATAADDPAGLGISERMRAKIRSLSQASRNGQDGISMVQTAESALSEVNNNLTRMRELSIEAANGTLNTGDRATLDQEFQLLINEITRTADTTDFNGINLLDTATGSVAIHIGADAGDTISIDLVDMTAAGLDLTSATFNIATVTNATNLLDNIDAAITSVTTARGGFGAVMNRLSSASRSLASQEENLSAAESRIRDVDVARETADLTRNSILQQAAVSVLSQANVQPQIALSLLQG